jgi:hypothetical protein
LLLLAFLPAFAREYRFDGSISEAVLRSYLSRSMTELDLVTGHGDLDDNIRMLKDCGVKFAGRTIYLWGQEADLARKLDSSSTVRKLPADEFSKNAGFFVHANRPT